MKPALKEKLRDAQAKGTTFSIFWLGCAQNQLDAEKISQLLVGRGYQPIKAEEAVNIIVLACSVRQAAIDRVWGKLRLWQDKKIYLLGCVLPSDRIKFRRKYPHISLLSTDDFIDSIEQLFPEQKKTSHTNKPIQINLENKRAHFRYPPEHAFVPIQFGCDNFCTYCAVPLTRGRERSRPHQEIIQEIKALIRRGKTYITLLGQNVNSYGLSIQKKRENILALRQLTRDKKIYSQEEKEIKGTAQITFSQLLFQLEKMNGLKKLDFLSPNPQDMDQEVVRWMAVSRLFSKKLNLPLQSGSDRILKKMNRRYSVRQYLALVQAIKRAVPDIYLTTDIIVGFPGETKKDFLATEKLCRQIGFRQLFIGKYSPRPGTVAAKFFPDDVSWQEKKRRWAVLNRLNIKQRLVKK